MGTLKSACVRLLPHFDQAFNKVEVIFSTHGSDLIYYIALACYTVAQVMSSIASPVPDQLDALISVLRYTAIASLGVRFIRVWRGDYLFVSCAIAMIGIGALVAMRTSDNSILLSALLIVGSYNSDYTKTRRLLVYTIAGSVLFVALLSVCGLINSNDVLRLDNVIGGATTRHALGFAHVNIVGMYTFIVFLLRQQICKFQPRLMERCIWILIAVVLFLYINSKTAAIIIFLISIISIVIKRIKTDYDSSRHPYYITACLAIVFTILGVALPVAYHLFPSNSVLIALNSIMSGRLSYVSNYLSLYNICLFGQPIKYISGQEANALGIESWVLDNASYNLLIHYGLFAFLLMLLLYIGLFVKASKKNDIGVCYSIVIISLTTIMETWAYLFPGVIVLMALFSLPYYQQKR